MARPLSVLPVTVGVLLGAVVLEPTFASLTAQTGGPPAAVRLAALAPPTGLSAAPAGRGVALSWSAAGSADGYVLSRAAAAGPDCATVAFTDAVTTTAVTLTDASPPAPQGTWACYAVRSSFRSWSSMADNPSVAVRVGVVATSVALSNGGSANTVDSGDRVAVTFNQAMSAASGPLSSDTVCATAGSAGSAVLVLGSAAAGTTACSGTDVGRVGRVLGLTTNKSGRYAATYAWSNGGRTLTITVGSRVGGATVSVSGAGTYWPTTASTALLSSTGAAHVCDSNAGGQSCTPAVTGNL